MGFFDAILLGIIQGITEFLPISSSGHLILAREFMELEISGGLAFDAILHLATALALLIYFRKDIWKAVTGRDNILLGAIVVGTIPAVVFGFVFESLIDNLLRSSSIVIFALLLGSALFVVAECLSKKLEEREVNVKKGFWIGFYQALALVPGMSRAGSAIAGGMIFGLSRERATRFAFLLGLPVLLGAGGLQLFHVIFREQSLVVGLPLVSSFVSAFVVGFLAIHFMISFLRTHSLYPFVIYRVALAMLVLVLLL